MRLVGKIAVLTGAGGGIGRATAIRFAEEGAKLVVADLNEEYLAETVDQVKAIGGQVVPVKIDVTNEQQVSDMIKTAVDAYGTIHILFNGAGISAPMKKMNDLTLEEWQNVMNVNANSVFLTIKHTIPEMRKAGGGSIVNTASMYGFYGGAYTSPYNASKGAVVMATRAAAVDFAKDNIRVNAIAPGLIDTNMTAEWKHNKPELWNAIIKAHLLKRPGQPREVANAVLFLASDEASFVTGTTIFVDGGVTVQ